MNNMEEQESSIIIVTHDQFVGAKAYIESDEYARIRDKIQNIVESHDCFRENIAPISFYNHVAHSDTHNHLHHSHHANGRKNNNNSNFATNGQHPHHRNSRKPLAHANTNSNNFHTSTTPRPLLAALSNLNPENREVMALLNKVSIKNIHSIQQKLLRLCIQHDDITNAIDSVITKLYLHPSYVNLYMILLKEFRVRYERETLDRVTAFINTLHESITDTIDSLNNAPSPNAYDAFCAYVKTKETFMNRFTAAIVLDIQLYDGGAIRDKVIATLMNASAHCSALTTLNIITDMVYETIAKYCQKNPVAMKALLGPKVEEINFTFHLKFQELPKKVMFRWQDIYELLKTS